MGQPSQEKKDWVFPCCLVLFNIPLCILFFIYWR